MSQFKRLLIILGLVFLSLPTIVFLPNKGTSDMSVWLEWTSYINRWGPLNAYSIINTHPDYERSDYPPLSFINIALALKASAVFDVSWTMGIKIMILGYYLTAWASLICLSVLIRKKKFWQSVAVASTLFLGSFFFAVNSEAMSYLDITYAPWVVFSFALFYRRKYLLSGVCFGLAILVKWLPVIILPAFLFYFISKNGQRYRIVYLPLFKFFGGIFLTFCLMIMVFLSEHLSLLSLVESLKKAFGHGSSLSPGALNFNWLVGYIFKVLYPNNYIIFIRENIQVFQLISAVIFIFVLFKILKSFILKKKGIGTLLQTSLMISWSYFIWRTGVHENHLFISVLIALCLAIISTNWINVRQYLWLSFFGLANLVVFYGITVGTINFQIPQVLKGIWGINLTELLAALQVFVYLFYLSRYLQKNG